MGTGRFEFLEHRALMLFAGLRDKLFILGFLIRGDGAGILQIVSVHP
jgi:hypothetical protein